MATPKQIQANRRNARHSTGPRTPRGKDRSRFNSVKHGLAGQHLVVPNEDRAEFQAFRDALLGHLQPANPLEEALCRQLVAGLWRAERSRLLETGHYQVNAAEVEHNFEYENLPASQRLAHLFRMSHSLLATALRYEARHELSFHRALLDLLHLRKAAAAGQLGSLGKDDSSIDLVWVSASDSEAPTPPGNPPSGPAT